MKNHRPHLHCAGEEREMAAKKQRTHTISEVIFIKFIVSCSLGYSCRRSGGSVDAALRDPQMYQEEKGFEYSTS